ncbi:MAG: S8 family serine peptidase [Halobacteria archaeon]
MSWGKAFSVLVAILVVSSMFAVSTAAGTDNRDSVNGPQKTGVTNGDDVAQAGGNVSSTIGSLSNTLEDKSTGQSKPGPQSNTVEQTEKKDSSETKTSDKVPAAKKGREKTEMEKARDTGIYPGDKKSPSESRSDSLSTDGAGEKKVVIGYKDDVKPSTSLSSKYGYNKIDRYKSDSVNFETAKLTDKQIEAIENNPAVKYVEKDVKAEVLGTQSSTSNSNFTTQSQETPWGIGKINASEVADSISDSAENGINVAVLDTGVDYTHEDLNNTVKWGADTYGSGVDYGKDAAMDGHGHGTHVSGTIAANDNQKGVVGVAPNTSIYAIKVLSDSGSGSFSDIAQGIEEAHKGPDRTKGTADDADVISMSLGGPSSSEVLRNAVQNTTDEVAIISAAGNSGDGDTSTNEISYPAKYNGSMAIAATNPQDQTATFSSEGEQLDVAAPGVNVKSTIPGDSYTSWRGTSMATPHVSGTAALILASQSDPGYGTEEIRRVLTQTAVDIESSGFDKKAGHGRIDALPSVGDVPIAIIEQSPESPYVSQQVTFDASNSTANSTITNYTWNIDGQQKTGETVTHTFGNHGQHNVTLNITTSDGNSAEAQDTVTVNKLIEADAGTPKVTEYGGSVELNGSDSVHRDGQITGYSWNLDGPGTLKDANTATPVYEAPNQSQQNTANVTLTVTDGQHSDSDTTKIYLGEEEGVWSTFLNDNNNTAQTEKSVEMGEVNVSNVVWDSGISAPAVTKSTVYTTAYNPSGVKAVDRSSGELKWQFSTPDGIYSSATVKDGKVAVVDFSGNLYVLNQKTGEKLWHKKLDNNWFISSPTVDNGRLYVSGKSGMHAFDFNTGEKIWSNGQSSDYGPTTPVVNDGKVYDIDWSSETMDAFSASTGEKLWSTAVTNMESSSATVYGDTVYVSSGAKYYDESPKLYAVNKNNGEMRWSKNISDFADTSPAVNNGRVFVSKNTGNVSAYSTDNGEKLWTYNSSDSFIYGSPAVTKNKLIVGDQNGNLSVLDQDTGEANSSARIGANFTSPISVGSSNIYFSTDKGVKKIPLKTAADSQQVGETGTVDIHAAGNWQVVNLDKEYDDPVVITSPFTSYNGADPAHTRIRAVRGDSFQIQVEEWNYLNEKHATESVNYMVVEKGNHQLADGTKIEAGTTNLDHNWNTVQLNNKFSDPVAFSRPVTTIGSQSIITRQKNVKGDSLDMRLQEEEGNNGVHATEKVDYVVVEGPTTDNQSINHNWNKLDVNTNVNSDNGKNVFAQSQTFTGNDPGSLRINKDGQVFFEEEQSTDKEISHTLEKVGYTTLPEKLLDNHSNPDTTVGEVGSVQVDATGEFQKIQLDNSYDNPVVVTSPLTYKGWDPAHTRVKDVKGDSFKIQVEEWNYLNEKHATETVNYMVVETGKHDLDNGLEIDAGKVNTTHDWSSVSTTSSVSNNPIVLSQSQTYNGRQSVVTRHKNVDNGGFQVRLQEEEGNNGVHATETVGYVTVNGSTVSKLEMDAPGWGTVEGGDGELFGAIQTFRGNDPVALRMNQNDKDLKLEEEQSVDNEVGHIPEKVGAVKLQQGNLNK